MGNNFVFLNNRILAEADACINSNDRGFLLSDGVFETLRCYQGKPFALQAHIDRLKQGLQQLKIPMPCCLQELEAILHQLLNKNNLQQDSSIRITVTRGVGPRGITPPISCNPTLLINAQELIVTESKSVSLMVSKYVRNEKSCLSRLKTLQYLESTLARMTALEQGCDDAILVNTEGALVCATAANIFFVKDKTLYTPSIVSGALPGITRNHILKLAKLMNFKVAETEITEEFAKKSDEIFISNSLIELQRVSKINDVLFENDKVFKIFLRAYQHLIYQ